MAGMTSKLVQDHNITVDWLGAGDLPLRLWTRVGYLQSLTQNYCGLGGDVTFHYDENLRRAGPKRGYQITSWTEI
jgi:hypothetical protein